MVDLNEKKQADAEYPIHSLIESRWSPRVFSDKKISRKTLHMLFEAARWAASSNNAQPWRFIYAYKGETGYDKLYSCLMEFNQSWAGNAPLLVYTAIKEKFDSGKENYHALHDLGLAVGNLCLQAQSMDIAVHQMAGFDWKKAQELLNVPEGYHLATVLAVGYYGGDVEDLPSKLQDKEEAERKRMPQEDFVFEGKWG